MNDHHRLIRSLRGTYEAAAELLVLTPGNRPSALLDTLVTGRAGIILNALDVYGHSRSRDYSRERRHPGDLRSLVRGARPPRLRRHSRGTPRTSAGLRPTPVVGGNAFVLARSMPQAGFRDALQAQLHRPELTDGGCEPARKIAGVLEAPQSAAVTAGPQRRYTPGP